MIKSKHALVGIYVNRADAEKAVGLLRKEGVTHDEISIILPHREMLPINHENQSKSVQGAEIGIASGAIIGGILGWLNGVGLFAIPTIGAAIVGGPIATILLASLTLASLGGLWGGLLGLGIPEKEAKHFESRLHKGHVLLSVHIANEGKVQKIKDIMHATGAEDLYTRGPMAN